MTREQFIGQVRQEQEPLRRFLLGLCGGNAAEADDLAQEALVRAYLALDRFEGRSRFSTWLFRIAYNCFYDRLKATSRNTAESLSPAAERVAGGEIPDEQFRYQALYRAIDALSPDEKAVILLFYMEDRPILEIAKITSLTVSAIKSRLHRGRIHLKNYLENER